MDTDILLKPRTNKIVSILYKYAVEQNFDSLTEILKMKFFVEETIELQKITFGQLNKINFFEERLYHNPENKDLYETQKTLSNFKFAILDFKKNGINREPKKVYHLSPDHTPGQKVYYNKLGIKPTGRDYGLLFAPR